MNSRILLADDDRLLREVIGDYLSAFGYEIDLAEDGDQAYARFRPGKYQLAILDLMMPGLGGIELMQKIRAEDDQIFCLIMTGYPTIDSAFNSMIEGASDYIIKPFQLMELIDIIQKYVQ